ncbi:hypothetical protein A0J61_07136, partial [Choanephora cucurbitarum]
MEFEKEAGNDMYSVEYITDYDSYTDLEPPEKPLNERTRLQQSQHNNTNSVTLDDVLDVLTEKFGKIEIIKGEFNKFVKDKCSWFVMDQHEKFHGRYLIMKIAPVHKHQDIQNLESRGYKCVYFSPYSPELNSIEQVWSV